MPQLIFNIATIERRRNMFLSILRDLSRQTIPCDRINVAMSYEKEDAEVMEFLKNNFKSFGFKHRTSMTCENKFFGLKKCDSDSYFLTFDDDIIYPRDYAEKMIEGIEKYGKQNVVGFHGIKYNIPIVNYKRDKKVMAYYLSLLNDTGSHTIGTGAMGCYLGMMREHGFCFETFDEKDNCSDGAFARFNRINKIKMVVLKHDEGWMKIYPGSQDENVLWRKSARNKYRNKLNFLTDLQSPL